MTEQHQQNINKSVKKLTLIVCAMFGFGFALVPLYDVFCDITGLNGKTSNQAASVNENGVDESRLITVQFISHLSKGIPWQFEPMVKEIKVHPGETKLVKFYAKNDAARDIVGQAVPSVSPGQAAVYFQKIECFCFNQQPLKASEDVEMALQFYVDTELPEEVNTITLSYTLYDITGKVES
ncbi:cytochrome c oxidase assembly protein [Thalassotalea marina]|uniref:Cytochrome c oxidase assembly protein CtaG n=1 Tax=Thalassotalea marina TaxID=1673741 RepID=A0A919BLS4_9GAMM|nr:cytochrome c oxidase assembly protein [Thalassotalea marina]GHF99740.1 cytochrome c oxidase assembly protein [Thalassotalea marina]